MTTLQQNQILLVLKRSKWERDLHRYGSAKTAKKIYERQNQSLERILSSHKRQIQNIELLQNKLSQASFIYQEELPFIQKDEFGLLVSVGGDNHFVYVAHFAQGRPILGINSDPKTSTGALLPFDPKEGAVFLQNLLQTKDWQENLPIAQWSRFEAKIDYPEGSELLTGACISEISVRSQFHDYISRYLIRKYSIAEKSTANPTNFPFFEEHKCSGLLLATGAGSTGWYRNCHPEPSIQPGGNNSTEHISFPKDAPFFRGVAREPGPKLKKQGRLLYPQIGTEDCLEIISEMDGEITVDADPKRVFPFPPGAIATFWLSQQKLNVIEPNKPKA